MLCKLCGKKIKQNINIFNFFQKSYKTTCRDCFLEHMNYFPYMVIPINSGVLHVFELLSKEVEDNEMFNEYLEPYYKAYFKTNRLLNVVYIERLDDEFVATLEKLEVGNLIIFTNKVKEEIYEI